MNQTIYRTGQFARKAAVSERTLRFYDRVGLLSPSERRESGYRHYTDEDLLRLQQILALKYLGFTLEEIGVCLRAGQQRFLEALAQQKGMMREKQRQLQGIIQSIENAEELLGTGRCDWESVTALIQAIQMEQNRDWVKKHFTEDQLAKMDELSRDSHSPEIQEKLQERSAGWTEADQERATAQWTFVATESKRLAAAGADPAGPEAQAVAKLKYDLLQSFTQGLQKAEAQEVGEGVGRFWQGFNALPQEARPFDASVFDPGEAGGELLEKALAIYREKVEGMK